MSAMLKLTAVGNSLGVVLPIDILVRLGVGKGDTLYVTETPKGLELTPYRTDLRRQMNAAEKIMRNNGRVLKKLAQ